jgi:aspartate/methionine/tyrosine aminotransferase
MGIVFATRGVAVPYAQTAKNGFLPELSQLRRAVGARTKAILMNNPSNPTGVVYPPELVRGIVELAAEHDLYVISDEIYEDFTFESPHTPAARFDRDGRVVTISGFSKTYSMTGWRLGYIVASEALAADLTKVEGPIFSCPSAVSQSAGLAALSLPIASITAMRDSYRHRRDLVVNYLRPAGLLPVVPSGAFYAFVDVSRLGSDSNETALALLAQERVATTPGESFGRFGRGFLRVSFATDEAELEEGLRRIVRFAMAAQDSKSPLTSAAGASR